MIFGNVTLKSLKLLSLLVNWSGHEWFCWRGGRNNLRQVLVSIAQVPLGELVKVTVGVGGERVVMLDHPEMEQIRNWNKRI